MTFINISERFWSSECPLKENQGVEGLRAKTDTLCIIYIQYDGKYAGRMQRRFPIGACGGNVGRRGEGYPAG